MSGQKLVLRIGFSHVVEVVPSPGLSIAVDGQTKIKVIGIDKEKVGQLAAEIRGVHPLTITRERALDMPERLYV
jgi:large subunit ribosomal protein L6